MGKPARAYISIGLCLSLSLRAVDVDASRRNGCESRTAPPWVPYQTMDHGQFVALPGDATRGVLCCHGYIGSLPSTGSGVLGLFPDPLYYNRTMAVLRARSAYSCPRFSRVHHMTIPPQVNEGRCDRNGGCSLECEPFDAREGGCVFGDTAAGKCKGRGKKCMATKPEPVCKAEFGFRESMSAGACSGAITNQTLHGMFFAKCCGGRVGAYGHAGTHDTQLAQRPHALIKVSYTLAECQRAKCPGEPRCLCSYPEYVCATGQRCVKGPPEGVYQRQSFSSCAWDPSAFSLGTYPSVEACASACSSNPRCRGFDLDAVGLRRCTMRSAVCTSMVVSSTSHYYAKKSSKHSASHRRQETARNVTVLFAVLFLCLGVAAVVAATQRGAEATSTSASLDLT